MEWIFHRYDHTPNTRSKNCLGTGRRPPLMATGLQRDVQGGPHRVTPLVSGRRERDHLGVRSADRLCRPFSNDLTIRRAKHGANRRIRRCGAERGARELQRPLHVSAVCHVGSLNGRTTSTNCSTLSNALYTLANLTYATSSTERSTANTMSPTCSEVTSVPGKARS